jgi:26S proteasome regulatory subunit N13
VECCLRAGKMVREGAVLKPDTRKGVIMVGVDSEELTHFIWTERNSDGSTVSPPETDIVIFPGEVKFEKVKRPGSRIFALKFAEEPDRDQFFWAQEPKSEEDDAAVSSINTMLNSVLDGMDDDGGVQDSAHAHVHGQIQSQFAGGGIDSSQLATVLGSIMGESSSGMGHVQQSLYRQSNVPDPQLDLELADILTVDQLSHLLENEQAVQSLLPYLPQGHQSKDGIVKVLNSPQFKYQLHVLTEALRHGQLNTSQLGLGPPAYGMQAFLDAIERQAENENPKVKDEERNESEAEQ